MNETDLLLLKAQCKEEEREECATLLENLTLAYPNDGKLTVEQCIRAIRARHVNDQNSVILSHPKPYKEGVWDQQEIK